MQRSACHRTAGSARSLVALLAVISVVLGACASKQPAGGNRVLVIGDSLLEASSDEVAAALRAAGWDPNLQPLGGTTMEHWAERIDDLVAVSQPDVAVIELGTNDCGRLGCPNLQPFTDAILRGLHSADAVIWLNVQEEPGYPDEPEYVNKAIEAATARWPNTWLVDMSERFAGHPEWHVEDGLHFNQAGQDELARLITEELQPFHPDS